MISHIVKAGARALGMSIALGFVLIVSVGGIESPHLSAVLVVILLGFFVFLLVFTFLLGPLPHDDGDDGADGIPISLGLRRRRSNDSQDRGESGEGESGESGTDGSD